MARGMKPTSHYWRVIVLATKEEQVFDNYAECVTWILKVKETFNDSKMEFYVTEIKEWSKNV